MSKRNFFSIFWEALENAFTENNINSAREKTANYLKRSGNAISHKFNSPLENLKLRTLASSASARTDAVTGDLFRQPSNRILEGDAQQNGTSDGKRASQRNSQ
ncbi:hypothetical protein K3495_g13196 [Podosphaera aphanis]|nr:hypothetical protein K3495_g13196 [Podosphaera aphanis]